MICTILLSGMMACTPKPLRPEETYPLPKAFVQKANCKKEGKPAVVAIIDTGLDMSRVPKNAKICKFGHKDYTGVNNFDSTRTVEPVPGDEHGHGTNIAGVISKYAGEANYCIVVLKYFSPKNKNEEANIVNSIEAIKFATRIGAKYLNYSGGGTAPSSDENKAIKAFLDQGGTVIAAAGNERSNLDERPYYPAMSDSRIITVGAIKPDGTHDTYSNFGKKVTRWEMGRDITGFGLRMTGTSQATAIVTGKMINEQECDK